MPEYSATELLHESEWRKCADDPDHFFSHYLFVRHPSRGRIPFEMRDAQRSTLKAFQDHERTLILKARQIGFSTLCAAYVLWSTMFHADILVVELSKTQRDAEDLLRKSFYAYDHLPLWMKQRGPTMLQRTLSKLSFDNDSVIESLPSREDPARGRSVSLVIVDEWAFLENPEEAWSSIEPITDIGGRLIGLSTANGWGNFFHSQWVGARSGTNGFFPIFHPWSAVPERDRGWYEAKKSSMLEWQLHQEYPSDEDEAFIKSGNVVFDIEMLNSRPTEPPEYVGFFHQLGDSPKNFEFRHSTGGSLEVWRLPNLEHNYVLGVDTAEGLEHGDYSSMHVIDVNTGLVAACWHGHIEADLLGEEGARLGWWYNTALIGVESNNHGLSTLHALRRLGYPRLYYRHVVDQATRVRQVKMGWRTDRKTKPLMIDELAKALREQAITLLDPKTVMELKTYVRDERGQMSGSPFDDRVMSLAVANQMLLFAHAKEFKTPASDGYTMDWWFRQTPGYAEKHSPKRLGGTNVRKSLAAHEA